MGTVHQMAPLSLAKSANPTLLALAKAFCRMKQAA
jgi:hypothetical protein